MLHQLIETILPPIIAALELIGILIVTVGAARAFAFYLRHLLDGKDDFRLTLFHAMAAGLEFKMAAEILKTVLVRDLGELLILGAVILLRGLIALMIHLEMHFDLSGSPRGESGH